MSIAIIVSVALAGMYFSYRFGLGRGRTQERTATLAKSLCPCEHPWGMHKDGRQCNGKTLLTINHGSYSETGSTPCGCTKYHGPFVADSINLGAIGQ